MQATGFRSLAKASQPSRSASIGMEPPPANGSTASGGSSGMCGAHECAPRLNVLIVRRVVPVREVGDESQ